MTKEQLIAQCKAENPKMFQVVNGEKIELTGEAYEEACENWASMRFEQLTLEAAEAEAAAKKAAAEAKLAALGLTADDLKALGL